jgi:hypothetical protein
MIEDAADVHLALIQHQSYKQYTDGTKRTMVQLCDGATCR